MFGVEIYHYAFVFDKYIGDRWIGKAIDVVGCLAGVYVGIYQDMVESFSWEGIEYIEECFVVEYGWVDKIFDCVDK